MTVRKDPRGAEGRELPDRWIIDWERSARLPYYTRANAGEVLPDPVSPLGWSLGFEEGLLKGWRRGFIDFGIYEPGELPEHQPPLVGVFGGYFYLNLSHMRLMGIRLGQTVEEFDAAFLGAHPDVPPYEPHPDDASDVCSAKVAQTIGWVLTATDYPQIDDHRARVESRRRNRPALGDLSDRELLGHARSLLPELDDAFYWHDFTSLASTVGPAILGEVCAAAGVPSVVLDLISGIGDIDSAAPSFGLWELSRLVRSSVSLTTLFDRGPADVLAALGADAGPFEGFSARLRAFLDEFGFRGPNEWDMHSKSWESDPAQVVALIGAMRATPDGDAPEARHQRLVEQQAEAVAEVRGALSGEAELGARFEAALASAAIFIPARERTKATAAMAVNEVRMAIVELGRRGVEAGIFDDARDIMMLLADELDAYVDDPRPFQATIRDRLAVYEHLFELEPPFIVSADPLPLGQWTHRSTGTGVTAPVGHVLSGQGGCAGRHTGRVRVILDPSDPTALEPGDVLVAPLTDAAWTPLFLVAGAAVVDVGATNSHAVVVCRELGIPCVVSVTGASGLLSDGAVVTVDGTAGTVTVDEIPAAAPPM